MATREENRRNAYHYIVAKMEKHVGLPPNFSNKWLANKLVLSDNDRFSIEVDLNRLEKGKSAPSLKLVEAFKSLLGPVIGEDEINSHLVAPFLTDL